MYIIHETTYSNTLYFFGGGNFLVKKDNIDPQSISSINFVSRCIKYNSNPAHGIRVHVFCYQERYNK